MKCLVYKIMSFLMRIHESYMKSNIHIMNCIGYTFVILFIQLLAYIISWKTTHIVNGNNDFIPSYSSYMQAVNNFGMRSGIEGMLIFFPLYYVIPLVFWWLFFKDAGAQQYTKNVDKYFCLKSAIMYMLPGEIIRFLLCIIPINLPLLIPQTAFGSLFGIPSRILFELIYVIPAGRIDDLRIIQYSKNDIGNEPIILDYFIFTVIYITVLLMYMVIYFLIYRHSWNKGADEYEKIYGPQKEIELPIHEYTFINRSLDRLESYSPKIKEVVVNAFIVFMCSTIIGIASNAFILLAGWVFTFPAFDYGLANLSDQFLWALWGGIGVSVCMVGIYPCGKYIGTQAADFSIGYKLSPNLDLPFMVYSISSGLIVYGIICLLLSYSSPADCFIAGPVQYLSRFLGKGERSLFIHDSFDYPRYYTYMAIGIHISLLGIMLSSGYKRGYKNRMIFVAEKERAMSKEKINY